MLEVPIKESFSSANIIGWITWINNPADPSLHTLAPAYYKDGSSTRIVEYAYVPNAVYVEEV